MLIRKYNDKDKDKITKMGKHLHKNYVFSLDTFSSCLVCEDDGDVIGFITYDIMYERAEIIDVYVDKDHRRKKVGAHLIEKVISICTDNKCENITLEVNVNNKVALDFYYYFNFKIASRRKNYFNKQDDAYVMERKLVGKMKDVYIFAIETSCDETSASIIKNGCVDVATVISSQIDIHKNYGGVVPEIASRNHVSAITIVFEECLKKANLTFDDIDAIAVTYGPGLNGALLVGIEAAKALSLATGKQLIKVNHMKGHIYANKFSGEFKFPLLSLVVSGGHTEIIYMDKEYSFKKIGSTLDDSVGEAFDKVARVIGVPYPGGPLMDKMAHLGKHVYNLPTPKDDNSYDFSFSGIKSAVINLVHNEKQRGNDINKENLATSFQETVVNILVKKTKRAIKEYGVKQLLLAGGVSANSSLRQELTKACEELNVELLMPKLKYCTDNASMIGAAAYYEYINNNFTDFSLNPEPGLDLN